MYVCVCVFACTYMLSHTFIFILSTYMLSGFTFKLCGSIHFIVVCFIKNPFKITNGSLSFG